MTEPCIAAIAVRTRHTEPDAEPVRGLLPCPYMPDPNTPVISPPVSDDEPWDKVDQGSWESFPASDPPAFGSTRAAPSKRSINESNVEVKAQLAARRRRRIKLVAAIGGGVIVAGVATLLVVRTLRARARC